MVTMLSRLQPLDFASLVAFAISADADADPGLPPGTQHRTQGNPHDGLRLVNRRVQVRMRRQLVAHHLELGRVDGRQLKVGHLYSAPFPNELAPQDVREAANGGLGSLFFVQWRLKN